MTRSELIKKFFPTYICFACEKIFGAKGVDWSGLTDETADAVSAAIHEKFGVSAYRDEAYPVRTQGAVGEIKNEVGEVIATEQEIKWRPVKFKLKKMDDVIAEQLDLFAKVQ